MLFYNRLNGPSFDLNWIRTSPLKDNLNYCLLLLPIGGGNKTKSGIKNQIVISFLSFILLSFLLLIS